MHRISATIKAAITLLAVTTGIALVHPPVAAPAAAQTTAIKPVPSDNLTDSAARIYNRHGAAVYQIQVIDLTSGRKTSIGSGFQFTANGYIATNYHVIADAIHRPADNRLEYFRDDGTTGLLRVVTADIVNDLAILQMDKPGRHFVTAGTSNLAKGARVFSLGNPHDIGFTIIEGTFNGISDETLINKIHFSGALNAGMSGGPALDHRGRVVGINVSTAGHQISFLVPVEALTALAATVTPDTDFIAGAAPALTAQLTAHQQQNYERFFETPWETLAFAGLSIPGRIHKSFKCWGGPAHGKHYRHHRLQCATEDRRYIDQDPRTSDEFSTGIYSYRFDAIAARENMSLAQFYRLYQMNWSTPAPFNDNAYRRDTHNFKCTTRFIAHHAQKWKAAYCLRPYKKLAGLYDMNFYMARIGMARDGVIVTVTAQGVTADNARGFIRRFVDHITPAAANRGPE